MMKKVLLIAIAHCCILTYAQVGIETAYPKGIFHIDGSKDNPKDATTTLTPAQQANDFIVLQNSGRVGIGTINPATNLEVNNGTTNGAIKISDGTQAAGRYLMSDSTGLAQWVRPNSFKTARIWTYTAPAQTVTVKGDVDSNGNYLESPNRIYSNLFLVNLTPGKWIINIGLRMNTAVPLAKAFWMHANLSSSSTSRTNDGWTNLGPAGNATGYASTIYGNGTNTGKGFLAGTTIIQVNTTVANLYLLLETVGQYTFDTSAPENYFYAIPIN